MSGPTQPWAVSTTVAALLFVTGCDSMIAPPPRDGSAPIQTDALSYELRPVQMGFRTDEEVIGLEIELSLDYTNRRADPIFIRNCGGQLALGVVRLAQNGLEGIWAPTLMGCLSPPIVIMPGETFRHTIVVQGAPPGTYAFPQWEMSDPRGLARIALGRVYTSSGELLPLEERLSNAFALY